MTSNFSSGSPAINWGEWRRLSNGQWGREGQDSSGNWYQDNQGEDPRDDRVPRSPSMAEFTHQFDSLTMNPQPSNYSSLFQGRGLTYGGYEEAPTEQQIPRTFASGSYTRLSEPDPRRHKGRGKHTGKPEQSESSYRGQDKGKSSRWKGDGNGNGNGKSTRSSRIEVKGNGEKIEQQTTFSPRQDQSTGAKDRSHSSIGHIFGRQPVGIDAEPEQPGAADEPHDTASNKEKSPAELAPRLDALVISDNSTVEAVSNIKAAEVDAFGDEALSRSPQSAVSSICLTEAFSSTSAGEPHLAISRRQAFIQQLIADVENILQTRTQNLSPATRGHAPASSSQTRRDTTSSRTDNEVSQPDSSPRHYTPQKKRKKLNQQSDGENSDYEGQTPGKTPKGKEREERQLACPYVKHGTSLCGPKACCNARGWPNVARVKEHLYRRHRQAPQCGRCQTKFEDKEALVAHQRQKEPCTWTEGTTLEGISEAQEKQLRSRIGLSSLTEEERWRKMYKLVFPRIGEDQIPSPYYDREDPCSCPPIDSLESSLVQQLPEQLANDLEEKLNASGVMFNKSQLEQYVTEALNRILNARDKQRAGALSEAAIGDTHSQPNQKAEPFPSASATGLSFPTLEDGSQAMYGPDCPPAPGFQQIDKVLDGTIQCSQNKSWGQAVPSSSNLSSDTVMADPRSEICNPSLNNFYGEGKWAGTLFGLTSVPVNPWGTYGSTQDAFGVSGTTQEFMNVRKPPSDSGFASLPDGSASISHANKSVDATTQSPLPQSSKETASSVTESILKMNVSLLGFDGPMNSFIQGPEFSTAPCLDPNGARVNHLEAGAGPQQTTGLEQQATVSGCGVPGCGGSGRFQNFQPWIYQSGQ